MVSGTCTSRTISSAGATRRACGIVAAMLARASRPRQRRPAAAVAAGLERALLGGVIGPAGDNFPDLTLLVAGLLARPSLSPGLASALATASCSVPALAASGALAGDLLRRAPSSRGWRPLRPRPHGAPRLLGARRFLGAARLRRSAGLAARFGASLPPRARAASRSCSPCLRRRPVRARVLGARRAALRLPAHRLCLRAQPRLLGAAASTWPVAGAAGSAGRPAARLGAVVALDEDALLAHLDLDGARLAGGIGLLDLAGLLARQRDLLALAASAVPCALRRYSSRRSLSASVSASSASFLATPADCSCSSSAAAGLSARRQTGRRWSCHAIPCPVVALCRCATAQPLEPVFARLHDQAPWPLVVDAGHLGQLVDGQVGQVVAGVDAAFGQLADQLRRQALEVAQVLRTSSTLSSRAISSSAALPWHGCAAR